MLKPIFHTVSCISFLIFVTAFLLISCTSRNVINHPSAYTDNSSPSLLVNINTADRQLLATLPDVGPSLAGKIVAHRTRYGRFRKIEHLLLIDGFSEKRFHTIRHLITTD
ncbi:MAG TPA: helix-hairpin-helix domain-containing protein [Pyrinomonadaceae bacterium]|nr:helix-hairpin-helix domain-containing protein [Pyrinomonadaceae bacterium]